MVPEEMQHMCDYINDNWEKSSPIHLAAYALWKLNWIHPFTDGNGRTARALSYLLLCLRLGYRLPGANTIPAQISQDKNSYYKALEAADKEWSQKKIDLSQLEELLADLLANQLVSPCTIRRLGPNVREFAELTCGPVQTSHPFRLGENIPI